MKITRRPFLMGLVSIPAIGWVVNTYTTEAAAKKDASPSPSQTPDVPNRTKVIRIIVVPSEINAADASAVQEFARSQGAAKTDTFIVKEAATGEWHPMSWLGGALVDHEEATRTDRDCTPTVVVNELEQVQWESDHEFWIESISRKDSIAETRLINGPAGPDNPFPGLAFRARGGRGKPIRSGTAAQEKQYKQLYKSTYGIVLEGREVIIDPDVYCEWH